MNDMQPEVFDISPADLEPGQLTGSDSEGFETVDDALDAALDAAGVTDDGDEAEAAPEEKPEAKEKPEPKPKAEEKPDDKPEPKPERQRTEDGKFQRKEAEGEVAPKELPRDAPHREAPARMSDAAKRDWASAPETVRADVHRITEEAERGIAKYKAGADEWAKLSRYDAMAKQAGTTVDAALERYVNMDRMIHQNPLAGIETVINNLGLKAPNGQLITFRNLAEAYLQRSPVENQNASLQTQMAMMRQEQARQQQDIARQREEAYTAQLIADAKAAMPRFDELRPVMLGLVQDRTVSGANDQEVMRNAYAEAERRFPATGAQTAAPVTLAQTQTPRQSNPDGRKSITGAPSSEARKTKGKGSSSIDEALDAAFSRFG